MYKRYVIALCLLATPASLLAGEQGSSATDDQSIEELTVHAHPLSGEGLSQAAATLDGDELERAVAATIGATVARQPGIHSAAYGEAVGRPVIHGLSGVRVRIMEDRIDAMDVSSGGPDHATAVDPFIANRIEVLKGPSTLLYGFGAIGGVVDVHTGRIPHTVPDTITGRARLSTADNGNQTNAAVRLDGGSGGFAWHVDAFDRSADDYDIPGFAESARLRAAEEEEHHDEEEEGEHHEDEEEGEHHEDEEVMGTLPGSRSDGSGAALGFSFSGDWGFAGVAVSRLEYDYGLPVHHHHHEEEEHHDHEEEGEHHDEEEEGEHHDEEEDGHAGHEEEGNVTLAMEQTRIDFEAGIVDPFAEFSSLNVRFGSNDYEHIEVEPSGELGTLFSNKGFEGRAELTDTDDVGLDGVFGVQFSGREFSAIGEEAFVPPVDTSSFAAFWLGERSLEAFDVELGARIGRVGHEPSAGKDTDFTVFSASLGLVIPVGEALLGLHGDYSRRAPAPEELYSNGPHLAAAAVEVGDPNLEPEAAFNGAATLSWQGPRASLAATAYATAFRDHIYLSGTGEEDHGLPVLRYEQADAFFHGIDAQATLALAELDLGTLELTAMFDAVAADLDISGNGNVPRLPASRAGVGLALDGERFHASVDYLRTFDQDETTPFEFPTDGYADLRADISVDFQLGASELELFLQGRNLTDDEQRLHTSFIKDQAPQPGRTVEVGVRLAF